LPKKNSIFSKQKKSRQNIYSLLSKIIQIYIKNIKDNENFSVSPRFSNLKILPLQLEKDFYPYNGF